MPQPSSARQRDAPGRFDPEAPIPLSRTTPVRCFKRCGPTNSPIARRPYGDHAGAAAARRAGIRRAGSLYGAAMSELVAATREAKDQGTFGYGDTSLP